MVHTTPHLTPMQQSVLWEAAKYGVESHGFSIRFEELEHPKTGTFNGLEIVLDPKNALDLQGFLLLHLFGHSVQWVAPSLSDKLQFIQKSRDLPDFLFHLRQYELEAAQFGLWLLHSQGIDYANDWFAHTVARDWQYVWTYYMTSQLPKWEDVFPESVESIDPKPIPHLSHRKVEVRFAF